MRGLFVALALFAAGCQPLPRPFEDDTNRPSTPALRPPDSAGIVVLPVAGAPAPAARALAAATAQALRDADIPASTDARNRTSYRLVVAASDVPRPAGRAGLTIAWQLQDADGATVGSGAAKRETARTSWDAGNAALAEAIARDIAPPVIRLVFAEPPPREAAVGGLIALAAVTGAPGDGKAALARAMGVALGRAGVALAEAGGAKPRFALSCRVTVSPPRDGKQQVTVRWVLAIQGGKELGQVSQQNDVPAGSLDGPWGEIAYLVASAAAPGIADLVQRAAIASGG